MPLDWQNLFASIAPLIPSRIAGDLAVIGSLLVSLCAIAARYWPRPAPGSRWLLLYRVVNSIAMNSRNAINADDQLVKEPSRREDR